MNIRKLENTPKHRSIKRLGVFLFLGEKRRNWHIFYGFTHYLHKDLLKSHTKKGKKSFILLTIHHILNLLPYSSYKMGKETKKMMWRISLKVTRGFS